MVGVVAMQEGPFHLSFLKCRLITQNVFLCVVFSHVYNELRLSSVSHQPLVLPTPPHPHPRIGYFCLPLNLGNGTRSVPEFLSLTHEYPVVLATLTWKVILLSSVAFAALSTMSVDLLWDSLFCFTSLFVRF